MTLAWLHALWALQYPFWWIAPNSAAYHAVRVFYARRAVAWIEQKKTKENISK